MLYLRKLCMYHMSISILVNGGYLHWVFPVAGAIFLQQPDLPHHFVQLMFSIALILKLLLQLTIILIVIYRGKTGIDGFDQIEKGLIQFSCRFPHDPSRNATSRHNNIPR